LSICLTFLPGDLLFSSHFPTAFIRVSPSMVD
jgi:hypothetical protein